MLTSNEDGSGIFAQVRRASVWAIHKGRDLTNAIRQRMLPQAAGEPFPTADKEYDIFLLRALYRLEWLGDAGDSEGMGLRREIADSRENHICMLAGTPTEATSER